MLYSNYFAALWRSVLDRYKKSNETDTKTYTHIHTHIRSINPKLDRQKRGTVTRLSYEEHAHVTAAGEGGELKLQRVVEEAYVYFFIILHHQQSLSVRSRHKPMQTGKEGG